MQIKRYLDVILVVAGAPILVALGGPGIGYGVGAGTWILVRLLGVAVDRQVEAATRAAPMAQLVRQLSLKLGYRVTRIAALGTATIFVAKGVGRADGLTTALVLAMGYTIQLICGAPLRARHPQSARAHVGGAVPIRELAIKLRPKE